MNYFDYIIIGCAIVAVAVVLFFALRTRRFFKTLITSAVLGLVTLFILYFSSSITGFKLELTPYTLGTSSVLGLPGVVAMVICKLVFGV